MTEPAYRLQTEWFRWSDYEIMNGFIRPTQEATVERYNPFNYFSDKMEVKQPKEVQTPDKQHIHAGFASINTSNTAELIQWAKKFGLPYSTYVDAQEKYCGVNFPYTKRERLDLRDGISVGGFVSCVQVFSDTVRLYNALQTRGTADLAYMEQIVATQAFFNSFQFLETQGFGDTSEAERRSWMIELEKLWDSTSAMNGELEEFDNSRNLIDECGGVVELVQSYLMLLLDYSTQGVHEVHIFDGKKLRIGWRFPSLLAIMYKMLSLEWTRGRSVIQCPNPSCGSFFIPLSNKTKYCSSSCLNNARQQTFRKKHKVELAQKRKIESKRKRTQGD